MFVIFAQKSNITNICPAEDSISKAVNLIFYGINKHTIDKKSDTKGHMIVITLDCIYCFTVDKDNTNHDELRDMVNKAAICCDNNLLYVIFTDDYYESYGELTTILSSTSGGEPINILFNNDKTETYSIYRISNGCSYNHNEMSDMCRHMDSSIVKDVNKPYEGACECNIENTEILMYGIELSKSMSMIVHDCLDKRSLFILHSEDLYTTESVCSTFITNSKRFMADIAEYAGVEHYFTAWASTTDPLISIYTVKAEIKADNDNLIHNYQADITINVITSKTDIKGLNVSHE